jgi:lipoprotein-releasing system permease protein
MFEISIALRYLLPKRRQISVALVSMLSATVISVVVWLLLVFLSVTEGLEDGWLKKLTSLNGPIRINPTSAYFNSYYYNIDSYSGSSNFQIKTLGEKQASLVADPYDSATDMHIANALIAPDKTQDGQVKDLAKRCFSSLEKLQLSYPTLAFQEYELGGASLRLEISRDAKTGSSSHTFLNQISYVCSLADTSPYQTSLLISPNTSDLQNILDMARKQTDPSFSLERIARYAKIEEATLHAEKTTLTKALIKAPFSCRIIGYYNENGSLRKILIPSSHDKFKELSSYSFAKIATLIATPNGIMIQTAKTQERIPEEIPITLSDPLHLKVISQRVDKEGLKIKVEATLFGQLLKGEIPLDGCVITKASYDTPSDGRPLPWAYTYKNRATIPKSLSLGHGIIIPKSFYDSGARLGDCGTLSYGSMTASSVQEQKIPIFIAGFYDPGIIAVGAKCFLTSKELAHKLANVASSYAVDKSLSNGILVWNNDLKQTKDIVKALSQSFQKEGIDTYFSVTPFYEFDFAKDILQQFQSDKTLFTLVGIIILIVACCNIFSLLNLLVNDKKKEIAILQALGARKSSLLFIFCIAGCSLGLLSALFGVFLAYLTLANIDVIVSFLTWIQGYNPFNQLFYGATLPSALSTPAVIKALILTPLVAFLAALIPALKAAQITPSSALRAE